MTSLEHAIALLFTGIALGIAISIVVIFLVGRQR